MVVDRRTDCKTGLVRPSVQTPNGSIPTYILRLLHSAQACGVVILLAAPVALLLALSCESVDVFRGVTPWKVWNMPPCVGTGIDGAMMRESRREGKG